MTIQADFDRDAITLYCADPDAPCQDVIRLEPTPEDARRLGAGFVAWADQADRAVDQPSLFDWRK